MSHLSSSIESATAFRRAHVQATRREVVDSGSGPSARQAQKAYLAFLAKRTKEDSARQPPEYTESEPLPTYQEAMEASMPAIRPSERLSDDDTYSSLRWRRTRFATQDLHGGIRRPHTENNTEHVERSQQVNHTTDLITRTERTDPATILPSLYPSRRRAITPPSHHTSSPTPSAQVLSFTQNTTTPNPALKSSQRITPPSLVRKHKGKGQSYGIQELTLVHGNASKRHSPSIETEMGEKREKSLFTRITKKLTTISEKLEKHGLSTRGVVY
ncbi:hypothetical protein AUEXF2481DRAFT_567259 [Aureobasidium subglaciale EXF-2481]|uniref:Uncharacterized protein n=1 Tax=Aureobasidium subglaciale (strain EXF-2481) TaxID=1043005 RepID=A0A074YUN9_AURSE|nr:uncharacterized protein AUEXF2481DRAFT_567259 [Aureobasidium subglaciale EXF-2481]KEQ90541.1 hypothetical protein AUEXF2481DRAFT_567259 [Aureobasidium subglaciale EXF-2481]